MPTFPHPLVSAVLAALLTLAAGAAPLRVATLNVELGLEAPGTASHDAVATVLARIDADVVALQEIRSADLPANLNALATTLGYPHLYVGEPGPLDAFNRNVFLSRHPLVTRTSITSPAGAVDVTRTAPAVVVDVPGTLADPTLVNVHLKCCFDPDDPFRRAVELQRVLDFLENTGTEAEDNVIILGDFNLLGDEQLTFAEEPPGLPGSFVTGADLSFPITYSPDPAYYFRDYPLTRLDSRQADGVTPYTQAAGSVLDHILISPALAARPFAVEIYNSELEDEFPGLPKTGAPLPATTSARASDHYALFADFALSDLDTMSLAVAPTTVAEGDPAGNAKLVITLSAPPAPGESVAVTLSSSDPGEAVPEVDTVNIPSGSMRYEVGIAPRADNLLDGDQQVTFTARAPGFADARAVLTVTDSTPETYAFEAVGQTVSEHFNGFDGSAEPGRWMVTGGEWLGPDDGSALGRGNYAYGPPEDPALGLLLAGSPRSATARMLNQTTSPLTALEVTYHAEQWRASEGGALDGWTVALLVDGSVRPLPDLAFTADASLPTGPIPGGLSSARSTIVTGLAIQPGESFDLRFTATPGPGSGAQPADVFLNELHYDNGGTDTGEFLEIVVGPGFRGSLANLAVVLYNGNTGSPYGTTHPLSTFTPGARTASGHRIFSKLVSGIQNGAPDGLAITNGNEVLHFLSYEGTMVATSGPAVGMTSRDIGVSQPSGGIPIGEQSLGLVGNGGAAADFQWQRFPGPHSPGQLNPSQTLSAAPGPQGLALDNLSVTFLRDTDQDGDPDVSDPDDDNDTLPDNAEGPLGTDSLLADTDENGIPDGEEDADRDGQSNAAEILLTLTDPTDPNSRFAIDLAPTPGSPASDLLITIPTQPGRTYELQHSVDLHTWSRLSRHPGTGSAVTVPVPGDPAQLKTFYRVEVSAP